MSILVGNNEDVNLREEDQIAHQNIDIAQASYVDNMSPAEKGEMFEAIKAMPKELHYEWDDVTDVCYQFICFIITAYLNAFLLLIRGALLITLNDTIG